MEGLRKISFHHIAVLLPLLILHPTRVSLTSASNLDCTFHVYKPPYFESIYTCFVRNKTIFPRESSISCTSGRHDPNRSSTDVRGIFISRSLMKSFPKNLHDSFPFLESIIAWEVKLEKVTQDDLKRFPKLRYLDLHSNQLTIIEKFMFNFNPQLEYINLSYNQISHVSPRVFTQLMNLNVLLLDGNRCLDDDDDDMLNEYYRIGTRRLIARIEDGICVDEGRNRWFIEEKIQRLRTEVEAIKGRIEELKGMM